MAALKPGSQQDWISNTTKGLIVKKVFLSRISCLRNNHKQSFIVVFKKRKKNFIEIVWFWSFMFGVSLLWVKLLHNRVQLEWLKLCDRFYFRVFCFIFTVLYYLVSVIGFYPVKLQLGKETDAIVSKVTIKWNICMSVWALL